MKVTNAAPTVYLTESQSIPAETPQIYLVYVHTERGMS